MSSDISSKAVRNFLFNGGRLAITMGGTVLTSAIIARSLGPLDMGVYGYAMWIVGTLGVLASIGLPSALTKYVAEYLGSGQVGTAIRVSKRLLRLQVIVAAAVAVLTACFMLFKSPYRNIIGVAAILLFAQALQQSLGSVLAGIQRFDRLTRISVYVSLSSVASVGIAGFLHAGVAGMLWATLTGLIIATVLYYRDIDKFLVKLEPAASAGPQVEDPFHRIRKFSLTVSYILLIDAVVWQRSEILFLKSYSTIAQIGFYTLAYSMASKLNDVTSTFSTTLMPLYSESYGRSGLQEVGLMFVNAVKYLEMLMVPVCFLGVVLAVPLVRLIYGVQFLAVAVPLQVLIACVPITSIGVVTSPLLYGIEKQGFIAKYGTVVAIVNILLDFILIPRYAALGAAVANCVAQIAGVLGGSLYTLRHVQVRFPWRTTFRIYLAALVALAPVVYVVYFSHWGISALTASVAAGTVVYLGVLAIVGELRRRDLDVVKKVLTAKTFAKPLGAADAV